MRFHAEHRFHGAPGSVAAVMADPSFYGTLDLPDLTRPDVLGSADDGDVATIQLRYEFAGSLDPWARRLVGTHRLAWLQDIRVDRVTGAGTLGFRSEADPSRLHGSAGFVLEASNGGTRRELHGELVVSLPALGRRVEGRILPGLLRRLDHEAGAIDERLSGPA